MKKGLAAVTALVLCVPLLAGAEPWRRCSDDALLKGRYVFTATGFTRPFNSSPGAPWVPKAIVEVLQFNGDGTLSTPAVTIANPFGDSGATFKIVVDAPRGDTIWMIQTHPINNVFQGKAVRVAR